MSSSADFMSFLATRRGDLRRIASRTSGEYAFDDVVAEAWLLANEMVRRRGFPLDFGLADDQEALLGWLFNKVVRYAEKSVRFAVRLDRDWDSEDNEGAANALARLLSAPEHFDPLVQLQIEESRFEPLQLAARSYSEASAWIILLCRVDWDIDDLADDVRLTAPTVRRRLLICGARLTFQPSLFDGINRVPEDFEPARRVSRSLLTKGDVLNTQLGWDFASGW
jgi:DNA-directed RNA polymerase specialized sigma24 family protein